MRKMICESASYDYRSFEGKTAKRRTFANFGQSSVTKTLPYIQWKGIAKTVTNELISEL